MSRFTPLVRYETSFEGDTVVFKLRRMKRKHMLKLIPKIQAVMVDGEVPADQMIPIAGDMMDDLKDYIESIQGLTYMDGSEKKDIDIDTFLDEGYFLELAMEVCIKLVDISGLSEGKKRRGKKDDAGKSKAS